MRSPGRYLISNVAFLFIFLALGLLLFPPSPYAGEGERIGADINTSGKGKGSNAKIKMTMENDRLSISIKDADIRNVLRALSIKKKLNVVAAQDIKGKISVNLYNVSLKDVLDAIITFNGFTYVRKDDIIFVTKQRGTSEEGMEGLEVRIYKLNYVDVDEIEKVIKKIVSPSAKITFYKPEKILVVEDVPRNLEQVGKVIESLDVPPRQVLIEARIMEIRLDDDTSLGIDWDHVFDNADEAGNIISKGFAGRKETGTLGLFFDVLSRKYDVNAYLSALQTNTEVHVLSSPRVLALDNREAKIIIGGKLGYYVTTATETAVLQTVEFLETGTQLVLTPHIVKDDRVIMEIHPEISDGSIINGLPTETTTEVTTSLMAPSGGTIFIGGLIRDRKEDIKNRVPGFGSIPVIGALFGKTTNKTQRTETIVLITPHIITVENKNVMEKDIQKVDETEKGLQKERSLTELVPGL